MKPGQATRTHHVDSISVHSNIEQLTVLPPERVIVCFFPDSYIAKLSIYHYKNLHISPLVCVLCDHYPLLNIFDLAIRATEIPCYTISKKENIEIPTYKDRIKHYRRC